MSEESCQFCRKFLRGFSEEVVSQHFAKRNLEGFLDELRVTWTDSAAAMIFSKFLAPFQEHQGVYIETLSDQESLLSRSLTEFDRTVEFLANGRNDVESAHLRLDVMESGLEEIKILLANCSTAIVAAENRLDAADRDLEINGVPSQGG